MAPKAPASDLARFFLLAAASALAAFIAGWTALARQIDLYHYDWNLRLYPPSTQARDAVILEFDDTTLLAHGGAHRMRRTLAAALEQVAPHKPRVVAIDLILAEPFEPDPADDQRLAAAMRLTPNLVLATDLVPNAGLWEEPYFLFLPAAQAIGHVHADPDPYDGVSRQVQLEKVAGKIRRWALALEAYRLALGGAMIVESQQDLAIGKTVIPLARRGDEGRSILIRYRRESIPRLSIKDLLADPGQGARLSGKVVFAGVTSQSLARDRLVTPYTTSLGMPGVEIHAHIYETLAQANYMRNASNAAVVLAGLVFAFAAAAGFAFLGGRHAYLIAAAQILLAHALPHHLFQDGVIFPLVAPAGCAWLGAITTAGYQYFVVRRRLQKSEADRARYQEAIHFVSHEMRSPLTAIQGSSELMSRYNLSEEKRRQIAAMIHSESKRLARMIQTFLDVERLSEGQMELRREPFAMEDIVIVSVERARPLAERKKMAIHVGDLPPQTVVGDHELMEYAVYNLLTNAVKYSPPETHVNVELGREGGCVRLAVKDQGIGMNEKELQKIFTKFYRTRSAEQSGEAGTGIGLSLVSQIIGHHGGRLEVSSEPGKGSCFTILIPEPAPAQAGGGRG
jgi:signal transduction histidine kinase